MESKLPKQLFPVAHIRTFNRTSMESKHKFERVKAERDKTFNRTSMESKPECGESACDFILLLIEPVWNRNSDALGLAHSIALPFNRTSMESKRAKRIFCVSRCC